jgi:hypothetical protein
MLPLIPNPKQPVSRHNHPTRPMDRPPQHAELQIYTNSTHKQSVRFFTLDTQQRDCPAKSTFSSPTGFLGGLFRQTPHTTSAFLFPLFPCFPSTSAFWPFLFPVFSTGTKSVPALWEPLGHNFKVREKFEPRSMQPARGVDAPRDCCWSLPGTGHPMEPPSRILGPS